MYKTFVKATTLTSEKNFEGENINGGSNEEFHDQVNRTKPHNGQNSGIILGQKCYNESRATTSKIKQSESTFTQYFSTAHQMRPTKYLDCSLGQRSRAKRSYLNLANSQPLVPTLPSSKAMPEKWSYTDLQKSQSLLLVLPLKTSNLDNKLRRSDHNSSLQNLEEKK
jgi:hypothetical protein